MQMMFPRRESGKGRSLCDGGRDGSGRGIVSAAGSHLDPLSGPGLVERRRLVRIPFRVLTVSLRIPISPGCQRRESRSQVQ